MREVVTSGCILRSAVLSTCANAHDRISHCMPATGTVQLPHTCVASFWLIAVTGVALHSMCRVAYVLVRDAAVLSRRVALSQQVASMLFGFVHSLSGSHAAFNPH